MTAPTDDEALRPDGFAQFVGQADVVSNLKIMIAAAQARGEQTIDHLLFSGPPGLGKTTLGRIIAKELHTRMRVTTAPMLGRPDDLATWILGGRKYPGEVLFIDEIHRLRPTVEEVLYMAMEDFQVDTANPVTGRPMRLPISRFTLVGATTLVGDLNAPLRDRFGYIARLNHYSQEELVAVLTRSAGIIKTSIPLPGLKEIARRSRGTPRIANKLLRRVADYLTATGQPPTVATVRAGLDEWGVDSRGLDGVDRKILSALEKAPGGEAVGLKMLAALVGESPESLESAYEPFLLREGLIGRTPRGRVLTEAGRKHLRRK